MKRTVITLLVILAIAGIAVVTCPDKQAHKDAIMAVVNEKIGEALGTPDNEIADTYDLHAGIAPIGSHVGGWLLDGNLTVKNNFVYSVGQLTYKGETHKVSIGMFGHVFTFSKEGLDRAMKAML